MITGSSQRNNIMQLSGIPLKQFDTLLESDLYNDAFKNPWLYSKYIILGKKADSSAKNTINIG